MDKASDFGSEDCRFESCHGRSTYIFLCLVFSQNYYKIVTNIYLIIYWWMNCKRHKHKILSGSQCTYSIETPQPSMRSLALENSKHDDYSPIVMINFADSFWANKCVCTYYVCVWKPDSGIHTYTQDFTKQLTDCSNCLFVYLITVKNWLR